MQASTNYGDYKGTISIDFPNLGTDEDFYKDMEVDTDKCTPIGFRFVSGNNYPNFYSPIKVSVYVIENDTWEGEYETVDDYLKNSQTPKVKLLPKEMKFVTFYKKYLKRFNAKLTKKEYENFDFEVE